MKRLLGLAALLLPWLLLSGCSGNNKESLPDVLCTTTMVADVVRHVAGDHQKVEVLIEANQDPHTFDPKASHVRKVEGAKLLFYSGLNLEAKLTENLKSLAKKKPVYALADDLQGVKKDEHGTQDPHVWFDLSMWANTADVVADALAKYDPKHADDYKANARKYKDRLLVVHAEIKAEIASIPKDRRVLVTAHDAFEYFGRAYDIEVKAAQGISTEGEAGIKDIEELVKFLTKHKIKAIFTETSVSDKNVKALQEGCENAKPPHKIALVREGLYSDSLGELDSSTGTLEGTIRHNVKLIVEALK